MNRRRSVTAAQARAYLVKASEYANAATAELEAGRLVAATSLAVHAGINAADAVCGVRLGVRSAGADHDQALAMLRAAGKDGVEVEKELRRLLPVKTKAEYDPEPIGSAVAAKAVERGHRCVVVAVRVVGP